MKICINNRLTAAACTLVALSTLSVANAWDTGGYVFCDANQNGQIDNGDSPLTGVLVVVTNVSGTYSNANFTGSPDGGFVLELPAMPDSYVEYLHPLTLPSDAQVVVPNGGVYAFTLDGTSMSNFLGNFLVSSASCTNGTPPPPPPPSVSSNECCLKARGTIGCNTAPKGHKKSNVQFVFEGTTLPACGSTNGDSGEWDIVATALKLHFQGSVFEIVNCGATQPTSGPDPAFIEFQGAGTLMGICGNKTNYGVVSFYARAEDNGHARKTPDRLYFRVDMADGTTVLLISGDTSNPLNIVPVAISAGDLKISTSCCETGGNRGNGHGEGEGNGHGEGNGKGNGNCNNGSGAGHSEGGQSGGSGSGNGNGHGEGEHGNGNGHGESNSSGNGHGQSNQGNGNSGGNCSTGQSSQGQGHGHGNGHHG